MSDQSYPLWCDRMCVVSGSLSSHLWLQCTLHRLIFVSRLVTFKQQINQTIKQTHAGQNQSNKQTIKETNKQPHVGHNQSNKQTNKHMLVTINLLFHRQCRRCLRQLWCILVSSVRMSLNYYTLLLVYNRINPLCFSMVWITVTPSMQSHVALVRKYFTDTSISKSGDYCLFEAVLIRYFFLFCNHV